MKRGVREKGWICTRRRRILAVILWGVLPAFLPVGTMPGHTAEVPKNTPNAPGLRASLIPEQAKVGDIVTLILTYTLPEGASLPEKVHIQGLKGFEVLTHKVTPLEPERKGQHSGAQGKIRFKLLVDRVDAFKTGPLRVAYRDRSGETHVLKADPVTLTVTSNLGPKPEEARLAPIYGILPTTASWLVHLPWILGGLLALALAAALFFWFRRCRRRTTSAGDTIPPHLRAQREIRELEVEGLLERGEIKVFYFRLSEILRRYLEALRGFPAAEYTTEEIAAAIRNPEDRDLLKLLRVADHIKFADMRPTPAGQEETLKHAHFYIQKTGSVFGATDQDQTSAGRTWRGRPSRRRRSMEAES
jgi:hypothetical protein